MIELKFIAGYIVTYKKDEEPQYLLLKRSSNSYLPGIWQMVTGKIKPNENTAIAVQREILEETGLVCSKIYNVDVTMFYEQYSNHVALCANFCAFVDYASNVKLSMKEHDEYCWVTFAKAYDLLAFPAQKETLTLIHKHYVLKEPHEVNILKINLLC